MVTLHALVDLFPKGSVQGTILNPSSLKARPPVGNLRRRDATLLLRRRGGAGAGPSAGDVAAVGRRPQRRRCRPRIRAAGSEGPDAAGLQAGATAGERVTWERVECVMGRESERNPEKMVNLIGFPGNIG